MFCHYNAIDFYKDHKIFFYKRKKLLSKKIKNNKIFFEKIIKNIDNSIHCINSLKEMILKKINNDINHHDRNKVTIKNLIKDLSQKTEYGDFFKKEYKYIYKKEEKNISLQDYLINLFDKGKIFSAARSRDKAINILNILFNQAINPSKDLETFKIKLKKAMTINTNWISIMFRNKSEGAYFFETLSQNQELDSFYNRTYIRNFNNNSTNDKTHSFPNELNSLKYYINELKKQKKIFISDNTLSKINKKLIKNKTDGQKKLLKKENKNDIFPTTIKKEEENGSIKEIDKLINIFEKDQYS